MPSPSPGASTTSSQPHRPRRPSSATDTASRWRLRRPRSSPRRRAPVRRTTRRAARRDVPTATRRHARTGRPRRGDARGMGRSTAGLAGRCVRRAVLRSGRVGIDDAGRSCRATLTTGSLPGSPEILRRAALHPENAPLLRVCALLRSSACPDDPARATGRSPSRRLARRRRPAPGVPELCSRRPAAPSASLPDGIPSLTLLVPPARLVGGDRRRQRRACLNPAERIVHRRRRRWGSSARRGRRGPRARPRLEATRATGCPRGSLSICAPTISGCPPPTAATSRRGRLRHALHDPARDHAVRRGPPRRAGLRVEHLVCGDVGTGLALPIGNHLEIDLSARDWIGGVDGQIRHAPMFALGVEVGFNEGH